MPKLRIVPNRHERQELAGKLLSALSVTDSARRPRFGYFCTTPMEGDPL